MSVLDLPTARLLLPDGRYLGYLEVGDPEGIPTMYFHGSPSSRLEAYAIDAAARRYGYRVIAPDRPGCGLSSQHPGRTILGWADDVAALADALGIGSFGVLGISGGGPYVLACAHQMPSRLLFAIDGAGYAPVATEPVLRSMIAPIDRLYFRINRYLPFLFAMSFSYLSWAAWHFRGRFLLSALQSSLSEEDKEAYAAPVSRQFLLRITRESFWQGSRGPAQDARLLFGDWGFQVADIEYPVSLFHGDRDLLVPFAFGEWKHEQIRESRFVKLDGMGHISGGMQFSRFLQGAMG